MIDAKAMRDISDRRRQELIDRDIVTLTESIEHEIDMAAQEGRFYINVNIEDYYKEAIYNVRKKLTSFCYDVSINCILGTESMISIHQ